MNKKGNRTVAAVIVTYNRKKLLLKNLEACLKQKYKINSIIIVDNHSTDNTKEYIYNNLYDTDIIDYIYMDENLGGSGGFSFGTKYAYEKGYDYIWLMDDDGKPSNEYTLQNLMIYVSNNNIYNEPLMINSLVCSNDDDLSFGIFYKDTIVYKRKEIKEIFVKNTCNPFNGTLLSQKLIELIGVPVSDYFIKGDEKEYLYRALKYKAYIGTVTDSVYNHPSPRKNMEQKNFCGKLVTNNIEAGWKEYYNMRNTCLNNKLYSSHPYIKNLRFYLGRIIKVFMFSREKIKLIKMITIGIIHANKKIKGRYYLPGDKIYKYDTK